MFADSLLETSWAHRGRRGWATLTSFGLQAVVLGLLLMIPVLTTVGVPLIPRITTPVSWGAPPPPAAPPVRPERSATVPQSNVSNNILVAPSSIPDRVRIINETEAPPQVSYDNDLGVIGSTGPVGARNGVWNSIRSSLANLQPPAPQPPTIKRQFRTSSILEGSLIRRVQPIYPPLARAARIQGSVILAAVIGKDGAMENLKLISGHPMLVQAAVQAVSQWRYRPYILNGEAIEVETQITVNFILGN
ncbi:MAG TPA: energy transducer TonB [Candidatus Eisenbacteria bacterium]|nr:energy transducer TonB [Candidatus Eisenbacteria bacterium]